jgi:hypothetical protein
VKQGLENELVKRGDIECPLMAPKADIMTASLAMRHAVQLASVKGFTSVSRSGPSKCNRPRASRADLIDLFQLAPLLTGRRLT